MEENRRRARFDVTFGHDTASLDWASWEIRGEKGRDEKQKERSEALISTGPEV